jgi:hypothetical protein
VVGTKLGTVRHPRPKAGSSTESATRNVRFYQVRQDMGRCSGLLRFPYHSEQRLRWRKCNNRV